MKKHYSHITNYFCILFKQPNHPSVSVAKLVNATVHATGAGGQTTLDSFLVTAGLHIQVRTNSVHALRLILGQALLRVRRCPH